jgi:hypothetical protein
MPGGTCFHPFITERDLHVQAQEQHVHPLLPAGRQRQAQADPVKKDEAVLLDQDRLMVLVQQKANLLERKALIEAQLNAVEEKMRVVTRRMHGLAEVMA